MNWFLQEQDWELGDFVLATPALQALSRLWNSRIPVYFDTPYIAELYQDCPFISRLHSKPPTAPFADNKYQRSLLRNENDPEDVAHYKVLVGPQHPMVFPPYVDACLNEEDYHPELNVSMANRVAVFFGCRASRYLEDKTPSPAAIEAVIRSIYSNGFNPILLGSKSDLSLWNPPNYNGLDFRGKLTIRQTVNVLSRCRFFVSNDTGLAHVAVALDKQGVALWGTTSRLRSKFYQPYLRIVDKYRIDSIRTYINRLSESFIPQPISATR